MIASLEKKTASATFLGNFRSSRPEVFFKKAVLKYLREFPRKHPWWTVFVSKIKKNILTRMLSWKFPRIFQNNYVVEHFRVVVFLIRKSPGLLTDIYLFFWHFSVFWVFFTSIRFTLKLFAINVEKTLRWRLHRSSFFAFTEKIFLCLVGSYYWDNFQFNQSINFQKSCEQNSLDLTVNKSEMGSSCSQIHLNFIELIRPTSWSIIKN